MGKGDEALEECTIAEKEVPTDEWVLSTLYQIFRNLKKCKLFIILFHYNSTKNLTWVTSGKSDCLL